MRVAHIVPLQWEGKFDLGSYRMTFASWITEERAYVVAQALWTRGQDVFLMLDHDPFEKLKPPGNPWTLSATAAALGADEVVLPDVLGDKEATLRLSLRALQWIPHEVGVMFVPQARTMSDWMTSVTEFQYQWDYWGRPRYPTIGLSSLRRETGLRPQAGSRVKMMQKLAYLGYQMHLLGFCSVKHFFQEELPAAREMGSCVRGVDTCAAFALGARSLRMSRKSPRLFLGDRERYNELTPKQHGYIADNIKWLTDAVNGD